MNRAADLERFNLQAAKKLPDPLFGAGSGDGHWEARLWLEHFAWAIASASPTAG